MTTERKGAVITGASQGIGAGLVRGFLDRGYRVVANSGSIEPAAETHGFLARLHPLGRIGDVSESALSFMHAPGVVEGCDQLGYV